MPTKKFTENLQEHEFMLGLRCRGRGRELFITVVYEIFLGGNIYMFGAEARQQEEGDISGNPPSPAQHHHTQTTFKLIFYS